MSTLFGIQGGRTARTVSVQLAITVDGQLVLTVVLFVRAEFAILASSWKGCPGRVSKGKLVTPTPLFLALACLRIAEGESVAV